MLKWTTKTLVIILTFCITSEAVPQTIFYGDQNQPITCNSRFEEQVLAARPSFISYGHVFITLWKLLKPRRPAASDTVSGPIDRFQGKGEPIFTASQDSRYQWFPRIRQFQSPEDSIGGARHYHSRQFDDHDSGALRRRIGRGASDLRNLILRYPHANGSRIAGTGEKIFTAPQDPTRQWFPRVFLRQFAEDFIGRARSNLSRESRYLGVVQRGRIPGGAADHRNLISRYTSG